MTVESLRHLLEFAVETAGVAGKITLQYFQGDFEIERKPDSSLVTAADRAAEQYIRQAIESRFPEDGLVGEEFGQARPQARRRWIIDPIDGTFSFVSGVPLYGVLIGIEEGDEPVAGVIHLPALGETVAAARGQGCHWQGRRARVSQTGDLSEAVLLATEMNPARLGERRAGLERVLQEVGPARTWGDCYGYVLVATGRADIMLDAAMNVWDCAALLPIIEEAGGRFTDWAGRRTIRGGNAVATNGLLHRRVVELLSGEEALGE